VAEDLVDGAGHLAALDMGGTDVVGGRNKRARQRLDPVAVQDDQVGPGVADIGREAGDGACQDQVLRIALVLVLELLDRDAGRPAHLVPGQAVALHQQAVPACRNRPVCR